MESALESTVQAVQWKDDHCVLLDQTQIPSKEIYLDCSTYSSVVAAIKTLAVRGAPAIGVAGAYAVVLAARECLGKDFSSFETALEDIASARPTAVNLQWAVKRLSQHVTEKTISPDVIETLLEKAIELHKEDIDFNRKIAEFGNELLPSGKAVITYCNTGDLATGGIGTAFGVLHEGHRMGKVTHVYACETRPVMQGSRLTAWELQKNQLPFTLICDNMAAMVMRDKNVGAVIVGADRIAANGDAANKIGTYSLAVLARHHDIPFYVAAPSSTFDLSLENGTQIPIEERAPEEIFNALGDNQFPSPIKAFNPAFDVTPAHLISALICERGAIESPNAEKVRSTLAAR